MRSVGDRVSTGWDRARDTQTGLTPTFPQHWIANNLFGLAFSLNGVELLHLNNVSTGCILLGGLFIYDIFWVRLSCSPFSAGAAVI